MSILKYILKENNETSKFEFHVEGNYKCSYNKLTSLEGAPTHVGGHFSCSHNKNLSSLEGAPTHVGGNFWCSENKLTSLEGAPSHVGGNFWCKYNSNLSEEEIIRYKETGAVKGKIISYYGVF
jgi:hypothetical protein